MLEGLRAVQQLVISRQNSDCHRTVYDSKRNQKGSPHMQYTIAFTIRSWKVFTFFGKDRHTTGRTYVASNWAYLVERRGWWSVSWTSVCVKYVLMFTNILWSCRLWYSRANIACALRVVFLIRMMRVVGNNDITLYLLVVQSLGIDSMGIFGHAFVSVMLHLLGSSS